MSEIPRWTLADLSARYELEPGLKDAFVEGMFDREIVGQWLRLNSRKDWTIYEIDVVDVPDQLLETLSLTKGNKNRVVALARALDSVPSECSLRFIVDRDLDHWFGELAEVRSLKWTDYCAIELYFLSADIIEEILLIIARAKVSEWAAFYQSMVRLLNTLYAIRLANRALGWNMVWLSPDRCLMLEGNRLEFDEQEFVSRLLMRNRRSAEGEKFRSQVDEWKAKIGGDPRLAADGHDFTSVIAWSIGKLRGLKQFAEEESIERLFVTMAGRLKELQRLVD